MTRAPTPKARRELSTVLQVELGKTAMTAWQDRRLQPFATREKFRSSSAQVLLLQVTWALI